MKTKFIIAAILLILLGTLVSSCLFFHDQVLGGMIAFREWCKSGSCSVYTLEEILQNRKVRSLLSNVSGVRRGDVNCIFFTFPAGKEAEVLALFPEGGKEGDCFDFMREHFQRHVKIRFESRPSRCISYAMPRGTLWLALWPPERKPYNGIILYIRVLGPA